MKLFEKVKNMFTEEIEEEKPVIKKEVRHVEIPTPRVEEPVVEEKKEEKLLFFDDKDFEDLEREEEKIIKPAPKKEEPLPYKGVKPLINDEPKKVFKPSPIISPVFSSGTSISTFLLFIPTVNLLLFSSISISFTFISLCFSIPYVCISTSLFSEFSK